jgi:hypothetical protein
MCARVGNQRSRGVVTARVRTDAVRSLRHQRRDLHQSIYPVPLGRSGLFLLSLVSGFGFPVRYTCVPFSLFTAFIPRSTEKAKKNSYLPFSYTLRATNFCFSYFIEFVSIVVESCC